MAERESLFLDALIAAAEQHRRPVSPVEVSVAASREFDTAAAFLGLRQLVREGRAKEMRRHDDRPETFRGYWPSEGISAKPGPLQPPDYVEARRV